MAENWLLNLYGRTKGLEFRNIIQITFLKLLISNYLKLHLPFVHDSCKGHSLWLQSTLAVRCVKQHVVLVTASVQAL